MTKSTLILVWGKNLNASARIKRVLDKMLSDVIVVSDDTDCLRMVRTHNPRLVILDAAIGLDLCCTIRHAKETRSTRILFLSSDQRPETLYEAYYAGCDDYLYTPFDEKEFLLRVQVLLRRGDEQLTDKSKSPKGELRIQDVVLDLRQRRFVTPQGQAQLTEKQIDLMFFLMSYPDRIFLTEQLLQVVWKSPLGTRRGGDLVRATICNIRRRFSRHNIPEGYILTRKGKGYMFTIPRMVA